MITTKRVLNQCYCVKFMLEIFTLIFTLYSTLFSSLFFYCIEIVILLFIFPPLPSSYLMTTSYSFYYQFILCLLSSLSLLNANTFPPHSFSFLTNNTQTHPPHSHTHPPSSPHTCTHTHSHPSPSSTHRACQTLHRAI